MIAFVLKHWRSAIFMVLIIAGVWIYKDWCFQISENKRQAENARQLRISDSTHFASQVLTKSEINEYLEYQNQDLRDKLKAAGIKPEKLQSLVSNNYYYRDTIKQVTDVSPLINSILQGIPSEQSFADTSKCLTTKGKVVYTGKALEVQVNDREFKNKTDAVVYEERKQWKFLFIKSRIFGKRQFTAMNFDECGESKILKIEKKK